MKRYILTTLVLTLALTASVATASETTGTLTTGVETGINGMVIVAPTGTPAPDTYTASVNVTLNSGAGTQALYYTTDGSTPTCSGSGTLYTAPVTISTTTTIKAIACYPQNNASPVASLTYTISSSSSGGGGGGGGGGPICTADADFNNDGKVDIIDLNILTVNWGSTSANETTGDTNCDGAVDIFDLNNLTTSWTG